MGPCCECTASHLCGAYRDQFVVVPHSLDSFHLPVHDHPSPRPVEVGVEREAHARDGDTDCIGACRVGRDDAWPARPARDLRDEEWGEVTAPDDPRWIMGCNSCCDHTAVVFDDLLGTLSFEGRCRLVITDLVPCPVQGVGESREPPPEGEGIPIPPRLDGVPDDGVPAKGQGLRLHHPRDGPRPLEREFLRGRHPILDRDEVCRRPADIDREESGQLREVMCAECSGCRARVIENGRVKERVFRCCEPAVPPEEEKVPPPRTEEGGEPRDFLLDPGIQPRCCSTGGKIED